MLRDYSMARCGQTGEKKWGNILQSLLWASVMSRSFSNPMNSGPVGRKGCWHLAPGKWKLFSHKTNFDFSSIVFTVNGWIILGEVFWKQVSFCPWAAQKKNPSAWQIHYLEQMKFSEVISAKSLKYITRLEVLCWEWAPSEAPTFSTYS